MGTLRSKTTRTSRKHKAVVIVTVCLPMTFQRFRVSGSVVTVLGYCYWMRPILEVIYLELLHINNDSSLELLLIRRFILNCCRTIYQQ
jgi:hypothetical protein